MKKHISYPSIGQFRNVIQNISHQVAFVGMDANDEPIYDGTIIKPTLNFTGTVKLHGTNASVCFNKIDGLWAQSRSNIITPHQDNAGFATFVETNKTTLLTIFSDIQGINMVNCEENTITIYGEWCGTNIQKGVGICNLPKSFFIFGIKISPFDEQIPAYWIETANPGFADCIATLNTCGADMLPRIFNVLDFQTYYMHIDFNMPQLVQNKLGELTDQVEKECPIAKAFGFPNTCGEGIVWSATYKGTVYRFKVKGEKHSASRVKTLASVDVDKLNSITEFVDYAVTDSRFEQAILQIFNGGIVDIKKLGDVIRWMVTDITNEELDTMVENGLIPKDVNKYISIKVRNMFMQKV